MKCFATTSKGCPSFSYIARKNNGSMSRIIPSAARLTFPAAFRRKKKGTPMSAAAPKQINCLFVRLNRTFDFTLVRSRGIEIYALVQITSLCKSLMTVEHSLRQSSCLKQCEAKQHRVSHDAPYRSDHIIRKRNPLHHDCINSHTDQYQKSLKTKGKQRTQVILPDLTLLPASECGKRDRRKTDHQ